MDGTGIERLDRLNGGGLRLPLRTGKGPRAIGGVMVVMGVIGTIFLLSWMWIPLRDAFDEESGVRWFLVLFGLLGLFGLIPALGALVGGAALLALGVRSEILWDVHSVIVRERAGPLRWSRRRARSSVQVIRLGAPKLPTHSSSSSMGNAIFLEGDEPTGKGALFTAVAYPLAIQKACAQKLAEVLDVRLVAEHELAEAAGFAADQFEAPEDLPVPNQPANSDIEWELAAQGLAVKIPAAGLIRGSKGLFLFALFWLAMCSVVFGFMVFGGDVADERVLILIFSSVFYAIGLVLLIASIVFGKRTAEILVAGGEVLVHRTAPIFGTKVTAIPLSQLARVVVGPSGMEVNNRPVMELQFFRHGESKKAVGLLSQRQDHELEWLAALLSDAVSQASG